MTQTPRFCEQCGTPLNPGARFCGQCGQPVRAPAALAQPAPAPAAQAQPAAAPTVQAQPAPPPAPVPAAAAAPAEPILGVIAGLQRRKGLFGYQTWNLVVTPQRLVFAFMTQKMMNDAVRQAQEQAKREGKGLLGRIAAQMGWLQLMVDRYAAMPVDETLAEQPENFFFLPGQIKKVKVQHRVDLDEQSQSTDHLVFETTDGKYDFELKAGRPKEAKQILESVLGNKVH